MRPASLVALRWLSSKYAGHRDDGLRDRLAEVRLSVLLHLLEDHGRYLGRGMRLACHLHVGVVVGVPHYLVRHELDVPLHARIVDPAAHEALD